MINDDNLDGIDVEELFNDFNEQSPQLKPKDELKLVDYSNE